MATRQDVREVVAMLTSDKAKSRDEGVKQLNEWLKGDGSTAFCWLLSRSTLHLKLKPGDIPPADSWPYLITVLSKAVMLEISASKKRQPKVVYAKTLRMAVLSALDPKLSGGQKLILLPVVRSLFNHVLEVAKDVAGFVSEYAAVLRALVAVRDYRYQIRTKTYNSLLLLFLNKASSGINTRSSQFGSKEDLLKCILTLHVLLENPPANFTDAIRNHIISGFCDIFRHK